MVLVVVGPRFRMRDFQRMAGTLGGLTLRVFQFLFGIVSLLIMSTTSDFPSVTAFRSDKMVEESIKLTQQKQSGAYNHKLKLSVELILFIQSYLVAAAGLLIIWSLSLAILDIYAILIKRRFRNTRAVSLFAAGDGITSTLIFAAACASAGITVLIGNDLNGCSNNHCLQFETSTGMAFMTWFAALPSFLFNFWSLASR